jgi:hypothetical protein
MPVQFRMKRPVLVSRPRIVFEATKRRLVRRLWVLSAICAVRFKFSQCDTSSKSAFGGMFRHGRSIHG